MHTTLSDGGGTPEEVARAAREAGLGFVAITDHNNLDAKPVEGYRDGVLVIVGTEVSTRDGHFVGLGLSDPAFRFSDDPMDALDDLRQLGAAAFAAHSLSARADLSFDAWELPGPWGLELINGDSQWRDAGWWRLVRTAALYAANRDYALLGSLTAPADTLRRWDELLARRDVAGIAGADAHSRVTLGRRRSVRFPSYQALFRLTRNHVLLDGPLSGRADDDARAVVEALARGRSYVGFDALAPADGFSFTAEGASGRWTMGDTAPAAEALTFRAGGRLPRRARLTLLRDGRRLREAEAALEARAAGPGVYRVEARLPGWEVPWILSNPIYVFDAAEARQRAARSAWPEPTPAPPAAAVLASFDTASGFRAEFDPSSSMKADFAQAGAGLDGSSAARIEFQLGRPGPGGPPSGWCALVDREARDLSGRKGLVLSLKGDGVYRLWVQVRDENPKGSDGGAETWLRSVKTAPEWRRVAIPFSELRSLDPASDGGLDLERVRALVFVLDALTVKPGTRGVVFIGDVGVY